MPARPQYVQELVLQVRLHENQLTNLENAAKDTSNGTESV